MNFQSRTAVAFPHEKTVEKWLREAGWIVEEWTWCSETRKALRLWSDTYGNPCRLRWLPDKLAAKPGEMPWLVDAKSCVSDTENYAIEKDAFDTYKVFEQGLHTRVAMITPERTVVTIRIIENRKHSFHDGGFTSGSGTSFYLVKKKFSVPFELVFMRQEKRH